MPLLRQDRTQPLHTLFMQQGCKDDPFGEIGIIISHSGQISSSGLARPLFISTSSFPAATHYRIAVSSASVPAAPR